MKRILLLMPLLLAAAWMAGCSDNGTTPAANNSTGTDRDAIQYAVQQDDELLGATQFMGEDNAMGMGSMGMGMGKTLTAINTIKWWRTPTSISKNVTTEFSGGDSLPMVANVTVTVDVKGNLHLLTAPTDSTRLQLTKAFEDSSIRYAVFERKHPSGHWMGERRRGWVLTGISGASVASPGTTRQILSVKLQGQNETFTITDPLALVAFDDLPTFDRGEDVTVTVETGDATDQVFIHSLGHRFELDNAGGGTFTGTWHARRGQGHPLRCFAVDVLSQGSIFDDTAPYDSRGWILPYRVERVKPS